MRVYSFKDHGAECWHIADYFFKGTIILGKRNITQCKSGEVYISNYLFNITIILEWRDIQAAERKMTF
jgi:hypothetical protein